MGSVMGVAMGLFLGAMGGDAQVMQLVKGREVPQAPFREQMRSAWKSTAGKSRGWAKSFGILTALFEGVECCVEKYRGKHDIWNQCVSGCVVGATLSAGAGPGAACVGCARAAPQSTYASGELRCEGCIKNFFQQADPEEVADSWVSD